MTFWIKRRYVCRDSDAEIQASFLMSPWDENSGALGWKGDIFLFVLWHTRKQCILITVPQTPLPSHSPNCPHPSLPSMPPLSFIFISHWVQLVLPAGMLADFVDLVHEYNSHIISRRQHFIVRLPVFWLLLSSHHISLVPCALVVGWLSYMSFLGLSTHSHL